MLLKFISYTNRMDASTTTKIKKAKVVYIDKVITQNPDSATQFKSYEERRDFLVGKASCTDCAAPK